MEIYRVDEDKVISGYVANAATTYRQALDSIVPLIGRLNIQRDALKTRFYARLEKDIIRGCVMPAITVAFVTDTVDLGSRESVTKFVTSNLNDAFVLDGIQRLNTLSRAATSKDFNAALPIYVNLIFAPSRDRLLYRMITLNNGQKPMSSRHQIEILADSFFDFQEVDLDLVPEKGQGRVRAPGAFRKSDFVKGYIAYLSESVSMDNQKIIEEKMDELIASRIIDSDIPTRKVEFADVVELINSWDKNQYLAKWMRVQNNFIGYCVGIKNSLEEIKATPIDEVEQAIRAFEDAFSSINVSKVNLGRVRREVVSKYIAQFAEVKNQDELTLLNFVSEWA